MRNDKEEKKQARTSQFILFGSIFAALIGLMFTQGQTYDNMASFCPPVEDVSYITVYAYHGKESTDGVTREAADFQEFADLCTETTLQSSRKSYVGIDYEDVMYTVEIGYKKNTTSFSVVPEENAVYHPNGKYLLESDGEALYTWLSAHSSGEA